MANQPEDLKTQDAAVQDAAVDDALDADAAVAQPLRSYAAEVAATKVFFETFENIKVVMDLPESTIRIIKIDENGDNIDPEANPKGGGDISPENLEHLAIALVRTSLMLILNIKGILVTTDIDLGTLTVVKHLKRKRGNE